MKEILGNNLSLFFKNYFGIRDGITIKCTYKDINYEIWTISDWIFEKMCMINEEEFEQLAGSLGWWRWCGGSNLGIPCDTAFVNGSELRCWNENKCNETYNCLTEYLCDSVGASQPKNVCACAIDLAKYNYITMGELFNKYEGRR